MMVGRIWKAKITPYCAPASPERAGHHLASRPRGRRAARRRTRAPTAEYSSSWRIRSPSHLERRLADVGLEDDEREQHLQPEAPRDHAPSNRAPVGRPARRRWPGCRRIPPAAAVESASHPRASSRAAARGPHANRSSPPACTQRTTSGARPGARSSIATARPPGAAASAPAATGVHAVPARRRRPDTGRQAFASRTTPAAGSTGSSLRSRPAPSSTEARPTSSASSRRTIPVAGARTSFDGAPRAAADRVVARPRIAALRAQSSPELRERRAGLERGRARSCSASRRPTPPGRRAAPSAHAEPHDQLLEIGRALPRERCRRTRAISRALPTACRAARPSR